MKLLSKDELQWSPIVANNAMNRERGLKGVNSYCKELKFDCLAFVEEKTVYATQDVKWVDLCCGSGNALIQAHRYFQKKTIQSISLLGIDLVNAFCETSLSYPQLEWQVELLEDWEPKANYDLITCVHGLHYVGDKLGVIEKCLSNLTDNGVFIANIDFNSIKSSKGTSIKRKLSRFCKNHNIEYDGRKKIIKNEGRKHISFELKYLGADDQAGPNYTGQPAVDSYYE